jgi:NitT/TauT family transport system substrate-binding protein
VRWVSPRGTVEVLDDYPYWVAKKFGYFGDIETTLEPGPSDATATVKLVDQNQADVGFPSPGVFSLALAQQGIPLVSVFQMGGADVFDFAFRKGEAPSDIKGIEGMTIVLGSAGWQSICDPMLQAAGVDISTVNYVDAGWPTWGTAVAAGQGDTALSWEGLRAQWKGQGLDFDYILGRDFSQLPANSFVIRKADFEDPAKTDLYQRYFRAWAAGLEFGHLNPRAATQIVMEEFPGLSRR